MPKPFITSIIICDNIYRDKATNKCVISGTFSHILSVNFPIIRGNMGIYVALTDISEAGKLQVIFRREDSGDFAFPLPPWSIPVMPQEHRNRTIELCGNISGLPIPEVGEYVFTAYWNDAEIGSKRISVMLLTPQNPKTE